MFLFLFPFSFGVIYSVVNVMIHFAEDASLRFISFFIKFMNYVLAFFWCQVIKESVNFMVRQSRCSGLWCAYNFLNVIAILVLYLFWNNLNQMHF